MRIAAQRFAGDSTDLSPHPSILDWPGNGYQALGVSPDQAPFVDVNSDGIYDPYDVTIQQ